MPKIIKNIFLISLFFIIANCDQTKQSKNSSNNIVVVKVFSSLTCPHCADFHGIIYEKLKNEYINIDLVKFEHHAFPLDLAALSAEKILQCTDGTQTNMSFLTEIYKKQNKWSVGTNIKVINESPSIGVTGLLPLLPVIMDFVLSLVSWTKVIENGLLSFAFPSELL